MESVRATGPRSGVVVRAGRAPHSTAAPERRSLFGSRPSRSLRRTRDPGARCRSSTRRRPTRRSAPRAVDQIVVAGDVGAGVADVAEERAERAVVVERQRQRADRAGLRSELDRHVHRDARARGGSGPASRGRRRSGCRPGRRTGRRCGRRGATADGRSSSGAGRGRSCWSAGRSTSGRPSAGSSNSPAATRRWIHWWLGLNRRVCPHIATRPVPLLGLEHGVDRRRGCRTAGSRPRRACRPRDRRSPARRAVWVGVASTTASTSSQRQALGEVGRGVLDAVLGRRTSRVGSSCRPTTATTLDVVDLTSSRRGA